VSGDFGSLAFDELHTSVGASSGEDLRAAGTGWARAADLLERQADALTAGLPALERAWDSAAGLAQAETVRALVARMRATADVARYNHAQMLAAADTTDAAFRKLDAATVLPAERDEVARRVAATLNETYANAAARLTEPRVEGGHADWPGSRGSVPAGTLSGTGASAVGGVVGVPGSAADDPAADQDAPSVDIDTDLPDVVGSGPMPARRPHGGSGGGQVERFAATPRPAVAPVLSAPSTPPGSPATPASSASLASSPADPAPGRTGRRPSEETYTDERGHQIRIRWAAGPLP
jgi:hypothetical protein